MYENIGYEMRNFDETKHRCSSTIVFIFFFKKLNKEIKENIYLCTMHRHARHAATYLTSCFYRANAEN